MVQVPTSNVINSLIDPKREKNFLKKGPKKKEKKDNPFEV